MTDDHDDDDGRHTSNLSFYRTMTMCMPYHTDTKILRTSVTLQGTKRVRWFHEEHHPMTKVMEVTHTYPPDFFYTTDDITRFQSVEVQRRYCRGHAASKRPMGAVARMKMLEKPVKPKKSPKEPTSFSFRINRRKIGAYNS
jgi:hypothetical protein